ncbi:hypothetical protein EYF80_029321 [Liparis tanakae]|uniref:Uncharacterized protein n=1 Tax=Liparis tanakae TaxID=230148 RepID=A0A4Z2H4S7_9TELE|nr:hypothetical protein EYF80_029321 [Liparis tanakae]
MSVQPPVDRVSMAGSGVAVRLHEFRESQDSRADGPTPLQPRDPAPGGKSLGLNESHPPPIESFDLRTLRALTVPRVQDHPPRVQDQRPPQTAYQEHFQAPRVQQRYSGFMDYSPIQ